MPLCAFRIPLVIQLRMAGIPPLGLEGTMWIPGQATWNLKCVDVAKHPICQVVGTPVVPASSFIWKHPCGSSTSLD